MMLMAVDRFTDSQEALAGTRAESVNWSARRCAAGACEARAAGTLQGEALCVEHFVARCYQELERMEALSHRFFSLNGAACEEARALLDECSVQTLRICLRSQGLNNLERGRLLDVLLWAGELSGQLRKPMAKVGPRATKMLGKAATTVS
jgi:hypothetical protein